jgi:16S rRNA (adenine1518-N6/adenine1519-N6)-dimethyltransferase
VRAKKRFGQHFLESAWVEKVVRAIDPKPDDVFVEIGPGRGALTRPLAARTRAVFAYEIDRDLAASLAADAPPNVTVVPGDFLDADWRAAGSGPIRVAGNLPYNVAAPILFKLTDSYRSGVPILDGTVMLQREVAERLTAEPGSRDYGVLTISIRRHADVERLLPLPPGAFRPAPKVHSAVVRLTFHAPRPSAHDESVVEALTQAMFTRRRKTLANALRAYHGSQRLGPDTALVRARIDATRRPETLTVEEVVRLANVYARGMADG